VQALLDLAEQEGLPIRVLSALRTCDQQNKIYQQGRTTPGAIVTKARGCISFHVLGRAIDFGFTDRKGTQQEYARIGELAKSLGFKWGGDFKGFPDLGHVEFHPGVTIEQLCPDPDDCEAALQRSRELDLRTDQERPEQGSSSDVSPLVGVALGLGVGLGILGLVRYVLPQW